MKASSFKRSIKCILIHSVIIYLRNWNSDTNNTITIYLNTDNKIVIVIKKLFNNTDGYNFKAVAYIVENNDTNSSIKVKLGKFYSEESLS